MAARVIDAAFALVYLRLLGRADAGVYAFVVVLTTFLDTLINFGLNALVAREVSRRSVSARAAFRAINLLRLGLWLVGFPVVLVVYGPLRELANLPPDAAIAGWVYYLALLPSVFSNTASGLLWAAERLELTAGVSVVTTALRTALSAVVLFGGFGLVGLAGASLVINMVTAAVLVWLAAIFAFDSRLTPDNSRPANASWWLRQSWPLFVNQLLGGLFFKVDALLMPALAGDAAAGVYNAAYKVSEGAGIIQSSFTLALFPRLSRESDLSDAYRMAVRALLQVAFPLAAGTALLADAIVTLVGGSGYLPDSAIALAILICYLPLSYVNGLTQYVLIAAGKQRLLTGAFAAALVFNVAANVVLIPRFSYVGAAWVTVFSELVLLVPFRVVAAQVTHGVSLLAEARAPVIATLLMAPVVWWVRDAVHPIAAIPAGAAMYGVALWALGGIDAQQRRLLLEFVRPA